MQLAAVKLSERVDWNKALERLRAMERKYRSAAVRVAVAALILIAVGLGADIPRLVRFGGGAALLVPIYLAAAYFRSRSLNRIGNDRREILAAYRSQVNRSILCFQTATDFCVVSAVVWRAMVSKVGVFAYGACGLFVAFAGYWWTRTLPQLRRERTQLS